jgi:hypothetical protein
VTSGVSAKVVGIRPADKHITGRIGHVKRVLFMFRPSKLDRGRMALLPPVLILAFPPLPSGRLVSLARQRPREVGRPLHEAQAK